MGAEVRVDATKALAALKTFNARIEAEVLSAMDVIAADVVAHAKAGHPKGVDSIAGLGASSASEVNESVREYTGDEGGPYAGKPRFVTHTGVLRNSIHQRPAKRIGGTFRAEVYTGVEYGSDVEFGTVTRRAFPFLRPALEYAVAKGNELIKKAIARALGRGF